MTRMIEATGVVRTGAASSVMAALRNLVIGVLSRAGPVNLAAALRRHAATHAALGIGLGCNRHNDSTTEPGGRSHGVGQPDRGVRRGDPAMPPYRQLSVQHPFLARSGCSSSLERVAGCIVWWKASTGVSSSGRLDRHPREGTHGRCRRNTMRYMLLV
jgi:hypothetical protein